jgi:four helix bundle protein
MLITKFENSIAWQKANELTFEVYTYHREISDFAFKGQIQRASISIMNNIAEGFERRSRKELKQFLYIAKGSAGEVRSMLYVSKRLNYIDHIQFNNLLTLTNEISNILGGLIKSLPRN